VTARCAARELGDRITAGALDREEAFGVGGVESAGLGEVETARGASEELRAELALELGDRAREGRGALAQELAGAREAVGLDDVEERVGGRQLVEGKVGSRVILALHAMVPCKDDRLSLAG